MNLNVLSSEENQILWDKYGPLNNVLKLEEEANELIESLQNIRQSSTFRQEGRFDESLREDLLGEIADTFIMVDRLMYGFRISYEELQKKIDSKNQRHRERTDDVNGDGHLKINR